MSASVVWPNRIYSSITSSDSKIITHITTSKARDWRRSKGYVRNFEIFPGFTGILAIGAEYFALI
jgi:hypothetical protein